MDTTSHTERARLALRLQGILAARTLDLGLARQVKGMPEEQRRAIIEWQRTARIYELIQRAARRSVALEDLSGGEADLVSRTMLYLDLAIEESTLPSDLVLYRGVRSLKRTFGTSRPIELLNQAHTEKGYLAGSVHAHVAVRDFTTPK